MDAEHMYSASILALCANEIIAYIYEYKSANDMHNMGDLKTAALKPIMKRAYREVYQLFLAQIVRHAPYWRPVYTNGDISYEDYAYDMYRSDANLAKGIIFAIYRPTSRLTLSFAILYRETLKDQILSDIYLILDAHVQTVKFALTPNGNGEAVNVCSSARVRDALVAKNLVARMAGHGEIYELDIAQHLAKKPVVFQLMAISRGYGIENDRRGGHVEGHTFICALALFVMSVCDAQQRSC
jgi:hypothetical protein